MSAENPFQHTVGGGEVKILEMLRTSFMDDTFRHRNNLPHHSHPPGTLLDQFLHLIPAEKNKDYIDSKVIQKLS